MQTRGLTHFFLSIFQAFSANEKQKQKRKNRMRLRFVCRQCVEKLSSDFNVSGLISGKRGKEKKRSNQTWSELTSCLVFKKTGGWTPAAPVKITFKVNSVGTDSDWQLTVTTGRPAQRRKHRAAGPLVIMTLTDQ